MIPSRQLGLPFGHTPGYAAEDFFHGPSNEAALAWLARPLDWPDSRLVVWGQAGSGKTHLLHVWAAEAGATVSAGRGLDWAEALAGATPIGVDDADQAEETGLLHLFNAAAELRRPLLLTAGTAPGRWPVGLPDLSSRLRATAEVELRNPDDELLSPLFARLLAERQLAVPEAVQLWLLRRLPRSPAALSEAAAQIDRALLASGGRMTRGLAAAIVEAAA